MGPRKRLRKSIKLDRVSPSDFQKLNFAYACEHCSHYSPESESCTLGYPARLHRQEVQLRRYHRHSHMAHCRFLEID